MISPSLTYSWAQGAAPQLDSSELPVERQALIALMKLETKLKASSSSDRKLKAKKTSVMKASFRARKRGSKTVSSLPTDIELHSGQSMIAAWLQ